MGTTVLLIYSILLLVAVLISSFADRSIISTSVLFLVGGLIVSPLGLGLVNLAEENELTRTLAELALFASLFTDGMLLSFKDLRYAWKLPGRALLLGMPLTLVLTAGLAHLLLGLDWKLSCLLGAVLSPTDPVFASAIIGTPNIPHRLRHLLHVESGINDGLALPAVLLLLAVTDGTDPNYLAIFGELIGGVLVGIVIPYTAIKLERMRIFGSSTMYEPLNALAIGLLVLAVSWWSHANQFLAAFTAGVTVSSISSEVRASFHQFGHLISELLKLAALLLFGAIVSPETLWDTTFNGWIFVGLVLILVRMLAMLLSLLGSGLRYRDRFAAGWFGPRGFASVVYGLLVLNSSLPRADEMFHLIAVVVFVSILTHSSLDILLSRYFDTPPDSEDHQNAETADS